ncbi:plasminogen-binding group A streptococcal M-like protein PAM isoform X2 [Penaeus indicus]
MGPKGVFTVLFMAALSSSQLAKVAASYPVSGAALSESTDGSTKTGECTYSDSLGKQIQIRYTETASGEVTITSGSGYSGDGKEDLRKCREAAEQARKEAEKAVEEHMKSVTDLDKNFKKQDEELEKTMKDLDAQLQEQHRKLQDSLQKQQEQFLQQQQQFFSSIMFPFSG